MNDNERFVHDLFTRTEAAIRAVRGDAAKEAEIFSGAIRELMEQMPDAKAPHMFSTEGFGKVEPLFDALAPSDEELDRWSDVLLEAWQP